MYYMRRKNMFIIEIRTNCIPVLLKEVFSSPMNKEIPCTYCSNLLLEASMAAVQWSDACCNINCGKHEMSEEKQHNYKHF